MKRAQQGRKVTLLRVNNAPRNQIQLLIRQQGELPYFYEGFEDMTKLLMDPPIQDIGDEKRWTDKRFPEWIKRWWTESKHKPHYLEKQIK